MRVLDVGGSRLIVRWFARRERLAAVGFWADQRGTVQLTIGRLHLARYRRPW